jgi:hypothetical protein
MEANQMIVCERTHASEAHTLHSLAVVTNVLCPRLSTFRLRWEWERPCQKTKLTNSARGYNSSEYSRNGVLSSAASVKHWAGRQPKNNLLDQQLVWMETNPFQRSRRPAAPSTAGRGSTGRVGRSNSCSNAHKQPTATQHNGHAHKQQHRRHLVYMMPLIVLIAMLRVTPVGAGSGARQHGFHDRHVIAPRLSKSMWQQRCGSEPSLQWLRDYITWHAQQRTAAAADAQAAKQAKYLVYRCVKPKGESGSGCTSCCWFSVGRHVFCEDVE